MRDEKLDFIRGWAMITIAINHFGAMVGEMGYRGVTFPTLTAFGFSSAAELFFLLSGYMVGLVYLRKGDYTKRLGARAWSIYKHNLLAFLAAMLVALCFRSIASIVAADYTIEHPLSGVAMFMVFGQHPDILGVLQLYVLFMLITPIFIWILRQSIPLALASSIGLYLANQTLPWLNLPGGTPAGDWQWNFSPFAWQLLFFFGIVAGEWRVHERLSEWLATRGIRIFAMLILFVLTAVYHRLMLSGSAPWIPSPKETLSPIRVVHTIITVMFVFSIALLLGSKIRSPIGNFVSTIGRSTLLCYTVSIPVTYAAAGFWANAGRSEPAYVAGIAMVLMAVVVAAYWRMLTTRRNFA